MRVLLKSTGEYCVRFAMPASLFSESGYNLENQFADSPKSMAKNQMPQAMGFQRNTQNQRKTFIFHGSALPGSMLRRAFFVIFRFWAPCGRRLGALWRLWGALCQLGVLFGGFGWQLGAQKLDQGPLSLHSWVQVRCGQLGSGSLKPYADSRKLTAMCHGPQAAAHGP